MSRPDDALVVSSVAMGQFDDRGAAVVLTFGSANGPVRLVMPAAHVQDLLSVCIGLIGQALPEGGETEHPTIPIVDWRVGLTGSEGVVLGLAPDAGGALAFRLSPQQATELAAALGRAASFTEAKKATRHQARGGH